ncbi:TolC family outer membrane protein [Marinivivus vitaminiproducens]|uniref:TolC family outer membrane protein n=1 Tax=Marinivivus vitaminiproducens TaxID=3035935 RepID=UPI002798C0A7|nr:TolC family outer membrane protein [Geminicoccaceae bacterium SCSIO 64248]
MSNKRAERPSRRFLLPLLVSALALTAGQRAQALTLEEAVSAAVATYPEVGSLQADRRAIEQELRQARALWLPSLDFRGDLGPEYSDNNISRRGVDDDNSGTLFRAQAGLTLSQLLFDGFATDSEIDRHLARMDSGTYRVAEAAEYVGLNAVEAYFNMLRFQEIVDLARGNLEQHRTILGQVRSLTDQGRGGIADVRQTEARLASAEDTLATAQGNLLDARATFLKIVGQEPRSLDTPTIPFAALPTNGEDAAEIARVQGPTVKIFESDIEVARADLRGSRSGYYPSLNVEAGVAAGHDVDGLEGRNTSASALLVMRYNLFRGGGDIAREREAFQRLNEAMLNRDQAEREAEEVARLAYNALTTARTRTRTIRSQVEANRLTRDAYGEEFQLAQRSLLDVLDSENELFLSRANLITAAQTEQFAAYRVLASTGQMLDTLEVTVPTEAVNIYRRPPASFAETPPSRETVDQPSLDPAPLMPPPVPAEFARPEDLAANGPAGPGLASGSDSGPTERRTDLLDRLFGSSR